MNNRNAIRLAILFLAVPLAARAQSGGDTFKAKCAMCHSADGTASGSMAKTLKIEPFKSPDLLKASDADLIAATTNGKGKMPAYSGKLTPAQIKDVVAYIRTLQK